MDYNKRLEELNSKLEREGLTEEEQAEARLYYSMALLSLRDISKSIAETLDRMARQIEEN